MAQSDVNVQKISDDKLKDLTDAINEVGNVVKDVNDITDEIKVGPVSKGTIISLVVSVVVTLNMIFAFVGSDLKLDEGSAYQWGSVIAMVVNLVWATWKNNDITRKARAKTALVNKMIK